MASAARAASRAPTATNTMPTQIAASSSAPMLSSDWDSSRSVDVHDNGAPAPVLRLPFERLLAGPLVDATQKSWTLEEQSARRPRGAILPVLFDIRHDGILDAVQVLLDVGVPGDPDENIAIALAADADIAEVAARRARSLRSPRRRCRRDSYVAVEKSSLGDMRKPSSSRSVWSVTTSAVPPASSASDSSAVMTPTTMRTTRPALPRGGGRAAPPSPGQREAAPALRRPRALAALPSP